MCGIFGHFAHDLSGGKNSIDYQRIGRIISRRGPDSHGFYVSSDHKYTSVHSRLSIVDLSITGAQPMESACGRYTITFNGEIYNHQNIRKELYKHFGNWRGTSDTETLLKCIEIWGVDKTLNTIDGMFAFAIYDSDERKIIIARDRIGEKPLYYYANTGRFVYSSSTRAITVSLGGEIERSHSSIRNFMTVGYIKSPHTIYENIYQLEPASLLIYSCAEQKVLSIKKYDKLTDISSYTGSSPDIFPNYLETAESLIQNSVQSRMLADVDVGCFLSGGIDSSIIAAYMSRQSAAKIHTFSIGFETPDFDEAPYAKKIAEFLGTSHHEKYVTNKDALNIVSMLSEAYDQPFADSSQIPTMLLSDFASDHTKVCLSGDGGDEVFGGYTRYIHSKNVANFINNKPEMFKQILATTLKNTPIQLLNFLLSKHNFLLPKKYQMVHPANKIEKMLTLISSKNDKELYESITQTTNLRDKWFLGDHSHSFIDESQNDLIWNSDADLINKMIFSDINDYLQNDILVKVDRASMFYGLEVRAPFLDPKLVQFGLGLPVDQKVMGGRGKVLLQEVLQRTMPKELFDRPKMGFGVPLDSWLRIELRDWSISLIEEQLDQFSDIFDVEAIRSDFEAHQNYKINLGPKIWNLLMLLHWNSYEVCQ